MDTHIRRISRQLWNVAVYLWIRFGYLTHRFIRWSPRCIRVIPARHLKMKYFKYFVDVETAEMLVRGGMAVFRGPGTIVIQYTRRYVKPIILARDGYCCVYCGQSGVPLTLDHVIPRAKGGLTVPSNLVTACQPCNQAKGTSDLEDFLNMSVNKINRPLIHGLYYSSSGGELIGKPDQHGILWHGSQSGSKSRN